VANHDFIGCGEARSKTSAQAIAAEAFVNFLKESGLVQPDEVPSMPASTDDSAAEGVGLPPLMSGGSSRHEGAGSAGSHQGRAWPTGSHQGGAQFIGHQGRADPGGSASFQRGSGPSAPPPSLMPPSHFAIKMEPPPKPPKQGEVVVMASLLVMT